MRHRGPTTSTLTVTDNGGVTNGVTHTVTVTAPPPPPPTNQPPSAAFASNCTDLSCSFTDQSTDDKAVTGWSWSFGDPASSDNSSTVQNPSHTFSAAGSYTVTLTARDAEGLTSTQTNTVTVTAPPPTNQPPSAAFASNCTDLSCSFADRSTDDKAVTGWSWSFGDPASSDNSSTAQNPSHTFSAAGSYTVSLTVRDAEGLTSTKTNTVTVTAPAPPNREPSAALADVHRSQLFVCRPEHGRQGSDRLELELWRPGLFR